MDIQWEEPPAHAHFVGSGKRPGRYVEWALALRQHPGKWAVLPGDNKTKASADGTAQNIRRGVTKGFAPKGSYETAVDGTKIWVRYVGKDESASEPTQAESASEPTQAESASEPTQAESPKDSESGPTDDGEGVPKGLAANVRAWAKGRGIDVPDRGRISNELIEQYSQALQAGENGLHLRSVPHPKNAG